MTALRARTLLAAVCLTLALSGCGLKPMYAGGGSGAIAQGLAGVEVSPIEGKNGWLMHNALTDRLGAARGGGAPRFRLDVRLDDQLEGFAILSDDTVSRERRTLRARYQLVDTSQRRDRARRNRGVRRRHRRGQLRIRDDRRRADRAREPDPRGR